MLNKLIAASFLAVLSSGCLLYAGDGHTYEEEVYAAPGDVTFRWSLAGGFCADAPEVKAVIVHIPGEVLANDGVYPCRAGGFEGIQLHNFYGGHYDFSIEAIDYNNEPVYYAEGDFVVDGDTRINVDLTPVGSPSSYGYLSWRFPANSSSSFPNCQQAGVAYVDVRIDGGSATRYACNAGFGSGAVQTPYLNPGTHSIELTAVDAAGYPYYSYRGTLQTFSGAPASSEFALNWAVGGVAIEWRLMSGGTQHTCSSAGVQNMTIHFQDSSGNYVYGASGDSQACDSAPIVYNYLLPGTYKVFVQGTGVGGTYLSSSYNPVTVTVRAGKFVTAADAATVPLYRQ